MKHPNNQRLQTILPATIATIFIFGASHSSFAQRSIINSDDRTAKC